MRTWRRQVAPKVWTRRAFLAGLAAAPGWAQGVSTRGVKPMPRGKPSGIPFLAEFTDVAAQAGLSHPVIYGPEDHKDFILETVGCGVAFLDYDNDGWLDLFVLSGTRFEGAPLGTTNRLYKNNRDGTFTDVTEKAGLMRTGWASAVTVGDYNNDGFEDLFVTYWGHNVLYRNNGDGTFTDVTREAGLYNEAVDWGSGCCFVDYDRDGHLDLFVAGYVEFDPKTAIRPSQDPNCNWKGIPVNCGPRGLRPGHQRLFHNDGHGRYRDVTVESGIAKTHGGYAMTVVAADFDNDGWPDIYVACDSTASYLFRNMHDGTFQEQALERGAALSEDGMEQAGMGVGVGDFNLDGSLDIFKTHFSDDTPVLWRNDGRGNFEDVTVVSGLGVETRYIGWGAGIVDLDNDGYPDLFSVTGSVYPEIEKKLPQYPLKTPRLLFHNLGNGKFEEMIDGAGSGISAPHCSRGCAFGDFDNDGDLDIAIVNMNETPSLLRNDQKNSRKWLKVRLEGTKTNRSALGSRVTVSYGGKKQAQEVVGQSSFYSSSDRRLHFGLGEAATADVEVRWTNGGVERFRNLAACQLLVIREGAGIIHRETWKRR